MPDKRDDVITWDEFFMKVAIAAQLRSKDPNTQVGACIADTNHRILSVGYNGTPSATTSRGGPTTTLLATSTATSCMPRPMPSSTTAAR